MEERRLHETNLVAGDTSPLASTHFKGHEMIVTCNCWSSFMLLSHWAAISFTWISCFCCCCSRSAFCLFSSCWPNCNKRGQPHQSMFTEALEFISLIYQELEHVTATHQCESHWLSADPSLTKAIGVCRILKAMYSFDDHLTQFHWRLYQLLYVCQSDGGITVMTFPPFNEDIKAVAQKVAWTSHCLNRTGGFLKRWSLNLRERQN